MAERDLFDVIEERLMVTSDRPVPHRSDASFRSVYASAILGRIREKQFEEANPPKCRHCDSLFDGKVDNEEIGFCPQCGWSKAYRGPQRPNLCNSCFHNVGTFKAKPKCAAMMYQMPDGTWRDRYNQATRSIYHNTGMSKTIEKIEPTFRSTTFECECYEFLRGTREELREQDPLKFYDRHRDFD